MAEQPLWIPGAKRGAISPNLRVTAMTKIGIGLCFADSQIYLSNEINNGKRGE
ncbi:hypothetical protein [Ralstonia pseudosolanacearum]